MNAAERLQNYTNDKKEEKPKGTPFQTQKNNDLTVLL